MLDPQIRDRLFYQLETTSEKIRIFEEVIIGKSRCDFFAVTDKLTGYEIKSDADSYTRLRSQVKSYDLFFNENYLVVGKSHLKSAEKHIPEYWGIICVSETVETVRTAGPNPKVRMTDQLRLLWKRELRHILARYNLPKYPQKSRQFITKKLADCIDEKMLLGEICTELFERDYIDEGFETVKSLAKQNGLKL